ncbi:MAG: DUF4397 domain-containing protein [Pseudomonadota bacterium]
MKRSWFGEQGSQRVGQLRRLFAALMAVLLVSACTESQDTPDGRGNVRAVHALSDVSTVAFLIEERGLADPVFQTITPYSTYDALQYDFNFDFISGLTSETERLATTSIDVVRDTNYTLILTGSGASPRIITVAQPISTFAEEDTDLEVWFANLSGAGTIDFYIGAAGFDPAAAMPLATGLARDAFSETVSIEAAEVEVVVTVAGDATQEVFRSEAFTLFSQDTVMVNLFDAANTATGDYVVALGGDRNGGRLVDQSAPTRVRLFHGVSGAGAVDAFIDDETTTPVFSNLAFGEASMLADIPEADDSTAITWNITATGNVGTSLGTTQQSYPDGSINLLVVTPIPETTDIILLPVSDPTRPLFDAGRVGVVNTSQSFEFLDIYFVRSDSTFEDTFPRATNRLRSSNIGQFTLEADTYELVITNSVDDAIVGGPFTLTVERGDITQVVIVESADPNVLDIVTFDRLMP